MKARGIASSSGTNGTFRRRLRQNWLQVCRDYQLYLLLIPVLAYYIIFHYLPMYGIRIAFMEYDIINNKEALLLQYRLDAKTNNRLSALGYGCMRFSRRAGAIDQQKAEREMRDKIDALGINDAVSLQPFSKTIHEEILRDAMYVNSSDYEGLSNAMIEAMAIGLPSVCTDCPAGGVRAIIQDGENGLLVPVGNAEALCDAMTRVADDPELAQRLSENGVKLRDELSAEKIAERWIALF